MDDGLLKKMIISDLDDQSSYVQSPCTSSSLQRQVTALATYRESSKCRLGQHAYDDCGSETSISTKYCRLDFATREEAWEEVGVEFKIASADAYSTPFHIHSTPFPPLIGSNAVIVISGSSSVYPIRG